jgi:multicomponent Na+:H+ antiporter subunit E
MRHLLLNITLAFIWAAVNGTLTGTSLLVGFIIGYVVLVFARPLLGTSHYLQQAWLVPRFILFFLWELVKSSIRVTYEVITPNYTMRPGIVAIPLDVESDVAITLLANFITLTPGTLSLDVSDDRQVLYIHAMYVDSDVETVRREIKDTIERRVMELVK